MKNFKFIISIIIPTFLIITMAWTGLIMTPNSASISDVNKSYNTITPNPAVLPAERFWTSSGIPIVTSTSNQEQAQIISDGEGGAIIVWTDWRNAITYTDLYAQKINSSGDAQWATEGVPICTFNESQQESQIISDGNGGAIIVWTDWRNATTESDLYAQRINSSGHIQWTAGGVPIIIFDGYQSKSQLISDGNGGAIIVWSDWRNATNKTDLYAQRVNSSGDIQWNADGVPICTIKEYQQENQIISDGVGGAIIVWKDYRNSFTTTNDIFAQRINSGGVPQWRTNGIPICNASKSQDSPQIISDGAGGAIIVWRDSRFMFSSGADIFAQKINSNGFSQWTANGIPICTLDYNQWAPHLTSDGAGGAIIVWLLGSPNPYDVYAQKVNSSGDVQWAVDGIEICTTSDDALYVDAEKPQVISDGVGGVIIVWGNYQDTYDNYKIFSQRVNSAGDAQWIVNGIPVSSATESQNQPKLVTDGGEGAIIIWEDDKNIYAQKVTENMIPISNHPDDFDAMNGNETINWILTDDLGGGYFRVLINDYLGYFYILQDWQSWTSNVPLAIQIKYNDLGPYNYTIEYYDLFNLFGKSDTVTVTNTNEFPTSNHPTDIIATKNENVTIGWVLHDEVGVGMYRVLVNDKPDNFYIWQDWQPWVNNITLSISINSTESGIFNYTIEYRDLFNLYGVPDIVIVTITSSGTTISFGYYYLLPMLLSILLITLKLKKKKLHQNQ